MSPCGECLRRGWLLERLASHLERERRRLDRRLVLDDVALIEAVGGAEAGRLLEEHAAFFGDGDGDGDGEAARRRRRAETAGIELRCRHEAGYPARLAELGPTAPALVGIHAVGTGGVGIGGAPAVAIVGTRQASARGLAVAERMGRELAGAGVAVISGLANGIDSAAHRGALAGGGATVAVLASRPDRAAPARRRSLHRAVAAQGAVLAELPLTERTWRWALQARNRLIAALGELTVLVEAPARSGSLITARQAAGLGRLVAVVPGAGGSAAAAGSNALLAGGRGGGHPIAADRVRPVRGAQDVLDLLRGRGAVTIAAAGAGAGDRSLSEPERALLARIGTEVENVCQLDLAALATLAGLESRGWVRRGPGGVLWSG